MNQHLYHYMHDVSSIVYRLYMYIQSIAEPSLVTRTKRGATAESALYKAQLTFTECYRVLRGQRLASPSKYLDLALVMVLVMGTNIIGMQQFTSIITRHQDKCITTFLFRSFFLLQRIVVTNNLSNKIDHKYLQVITMLQEKKTHVYCIYLLVITSLLKQFKRVKCGRIFYYVITIHRRVDNTSNSTRKGNLLVTYGIQINTVIQKYKTEKM